ncbi:hypothetical protein [Gordonia sp. CPCC 205333]|uniref:hypothetical protein n=1 Tax=Gordonia sp. CPCC 205333 TaxID=3140790 RepID=UPI003AF35AE2
MARLPSYITRVDTARGPRYEARINTTLPNGKRLQHRKRFVTVDDAKAWHAATTAELATGTHAAPSDVTVAEAVDSWLTAKTARTKPFTAAAYRFALKPVTEKYGDVRAQKITKHDVEALVTELRTGSAERAAALHMNSKFAAGFHEWRDAWLRERAELATGFTPLTSTTFPRAYDPEKMQWTATSEGGTARSWEDESGSFKLEFTSSATVADPYRFRVQFAPWAMIQVADGLSVSDWRDHWCSNLVTLVSAATGRAEKLTHLTFRTADSVVTVFTAAITQNPYYADQDRSTPVCYRIGSDGGDSPLTALRHIQFKRTEGHPLIDGYDPMILSRAQHPRSRVLQLVQWLEAGYGFDTRDEWEVRVEKHRTKRAELLEVLKAAQDDGVLTRAQLKFVKDSIGKSPRSTLDTTLKAVFDRHEGLEPRRRLGALRVIATEMEDENRNSVESAVRIVRNRLSHGTGTYNVHELDQLADLLRQLVRADYLALLGCEYRASEVFPLGE